MDGLDFLPVAEAQQPFARPVKRGEAMRDSGGDDSYRSASAARKPFDSDVIAAKSVAPR